MFLNTILYAMSRAEAIGRSLFSSSLPLAGAWMLMWLIFKYFSLTRSLHSLFFFVGFLTWHQLCSVNVLTLQVGAEF